MNFLKCSTIPFKDIPLEKVATKKKYIPSKKTEKFINGNYRICSWFGSHFDLEWPLLHLGIELVMCLLFQKILLFHTNILIPNTHPYVWFKLSYECFRVPFLPLYLLFWPFWGLFTYIGVSKTWPHKKDVHHFWSLHPPWRYAPSVGLKHDTNGNFLALGLTWIPKMGGWLLYYFDTSIFYSS